jgi:hypothetical protein
MAAYGALPPFTSTAAKDPLPPNLPIRWPRPERQVQGKGRRKSPIVCLAADNRHWGLKNYEIRNGFAFA